MPGMVWWCRARAVSAAAGSDGYNARGALKAQAYLFTWIAATTAPDPGLIHHSIKAGRVYLAQGTRYKTRVCCGVVLQSQGNF